jgi:hypothetical protein
LGGDVVLDGELADELGPAVEVVAGLVLDRARQKGRAGHDTS